MARLGFELRKLTPADGAAFDAAHALVPPDNPTFFQGLQPGMGLYSYLTWLDARERGFGLRAHEVPSTVLFAFFGTALVGRCSVRHRLTPDLEAYAGHIGYAVLPPWRRMGVATQLLNAACRIARDAHGIDTVVVTCDEDNLPSRAVIERCGGDFDGLYSGPLVPHVKRRYVLRSAD